MDYAPHTDDQIREMLRAIGVESVEALVADIPAEARCRSFELPAGLSELEVLQQAETLALPTKSLRELIPCLGFGAYQHVIPSAVDSLASRGEWLTPYTPYQAEASQGTLQMIYEFQSMVGELLQMDVANASMYDGASAFAESAVMALRATGRNRILVSETVHPHYREVLATYVQGFPCVVQEIPQVEGVTDVEALAAALTDDVAAVLVQQPNVFGCLEPVEQAAELAHRAGALLVSSVYPISLGVLQPPGAYGADIAVGEGRVLGSPIGYGGPGLGLFAAKQAFLRRMPGRLAGCSVDQAQRRAFTLTLQTREQHIRREQATSNICTNAGWLCVRAAIFMSLLGPQGLRDLATLNLQRAHDLSDALRKIDWIEPVFDRPFFNEFAVRYTKGRTVEGVNRALAQAGVLGGLALRRWYPDAGEAALWCATELVTQEQIDAVVAALRTR
jgi:glycine dehydrogenase subunit 1